MKNLLFTLVILLFTLTAKPQVTATVYGWMDDYTKSFCKELTQSNISWSFCDIWGKDSVCVKEMWNVINKYHLLWGGASILPILKVTANGQEFGFCVACDRAGVIKKLKAFIVTGIMEQRTTEVTVISDRILNLNQEMIDVYSMTGSKMFSSDDHEIKTDYLDPGVYVARFRGYTLKFVKP